VFTPYDHHWVVAFVRGFIDAGTNSRTPAAFFGGRPAMTVAAWVAPVGSWGCFDTLWRPCRKHAGIKRFHMTDYTARQREYACWSEQKRRAVVDDLLALLADTVVYGVSISIDLRQFEELWPEVHPYIFCASQCISLMAERLKERGTTEKVFYVYDDGDQRSAQFRLALSDVISLEERYREMFRIHTLAPGSGTEWPGLDAADYLAWVGGHYPGYYYDRAVALNRAEFWRLHDSDLARAVDVIRSQTTDEFPELKRLARKWNFRPEDV
jgi:hypothetical protein